jgi:YidC/Oxa1 family membrane protein insertase
MSDSKSSTSSNFILFMLLAFGVVVANGYLFGQRKPAEKPKAVAQAEPGKAEGEAKKPEPAKEAAKAEKAPEPDKSAEQPAPQKPAEAEKPPQAAAPAKPVPAVTAPQRWVTLGSADPESPYRMLVTLTDRGAAVARIELNSDRYRSLTGPDDKLAYKGGYLGRVVMEETREGTGAAVQVVGPGTPAAKAGLKPGDLIVAVDGRTVTGEESLHKALEKTKPNRDAVLTVSRDGKEQQLTATLSHPPMEVIRPEGDDPLSFLLTLAQVDDEKLSETVADVDAPKDQRPGYVNKEMAGLSLRSGTWTIARQTEDAVEFQCELPRWGLTVVKTYRLEKVPEDARDDADAKAYHLVFDVEIRNTSGQARRVAYQLDGPTGLPIEGYWYASKVGRGSSGLRDVVVLLEGGKPGEVGCTSIAKDDSKSLWQDQSLTYIGVDAQYFSAVLIPQKESPAEIWFAQSQPLRVGPVKKDFERLTDASFRARSLVRDLAPGKSLAHRFEIFAGPKRPELLANYGLGELVYYGWFGAVAKPMVWVLHKLHAIVGNWGVAIILLTVLVRGLMFPISRKQALGAQKMAELQPEIKKLQERYKKDLEARTKAQQELFKKHKYNPMSGCLVVFLQLPIFIGLYRGLMVDIELRGSSLLWNGIRWCSNLAAPDMLFNWSGFMPAFINDGLSWYSLGPYFNLLPLLTVVLFQIQQKMFMPPPVDEQQAMQQNIMKYMMLFMGILFFKVASGLCVYFIASSLWGLAERKFLPKPAGKK